MSRADLRIYPPVDGACFVRFQPGDDLTMKDFIDWMLENDIRAMDDDQFVSWEGELDPEKVITEAAAERPMLWCWFTEANAVLARLRWVEVIRK